MDEATFFLIAFGVGCLTGVCLCLWSYYRRNDGIVAGSPLSSDSTRLR